MKRNLFVYAALLSFAASAFSSHALAKTDYCQYSKTKRSVEVHLFGNTYGYDGDKRRFQSGIQNIFNSLKMGDRFKLIHHNNGQIKDLEICFPGCPKKSLLESLTAKCSVEIAKKEKSQLRKRVSAILGQAIKSGGEPYRIVDQLKTLDEYYTNRELVESYVFNSTVPYGVDIDSKSSLDKAFVEMVQSGSLGTITIPNVKFVNVNPSKALQSLWADLALDGSEGLDFDIQTVILD